MGKAVVKGGNAKAEVEVGYFRTEGKMDYMAGTFSTANWQNSVRDKTVCVIIYK